jgi:multicomponent Na+:H+ antiporter subunit G
MDLARDIASWVLLGAGAAFTLTGGIGVLRLPDFYTRLHAASLVDTAGVGLIFLGLMLQSPSWLVAVKLLLILAFLFFTSPTATHALAKAALGDGLKPWTRPGPKEEPPSTSS